MIKLFREEGSISSKELLIKLNIEPSQTDLVKALNKQIEMLENYGMLEYTGRGWKWKQ